MIFQIKEEVYLFTYNTVEDLPCTKDFWFENLAEAEDYCDEKFGELEWIEIKDPKQGEQHDIIAT